MDSEIPVLDFDVFKVGSTADVGQPSNDVRELAQNLVHAFQTVGFVYLKNHGISQSQVS